MNYIKDINLKSSIYYNAIIEIPKGTSNKYELVEPNNNEVKYVRKVHGKYPFYYGCFPQTLAPDNDPLDMILLTNKKRNILDIIEVKVIGVIKTIDAGEQDDKIICVDPYEVLTNKDKQINKMLHFLKKYKGKKSEMVLDTKLYSQAEAFEIVSKCYKLYRNKNTDTIKVTF